MPQQRNGNKAKADDAGGALAPYGGTPGFMTQIRDEFDRLFDRFTRQWPGMNSFRDQPWHWGWGLDVREAADAVTVRAEMPGFDTDDIDLQVEDNRLVIRAAHKAEGGDPKGQGQTWQRREYYQAVSLPAGVDADTVDASFRNGVLSVRLPKTEAAKGRKVTIRKD
jgi:HSP20 family protein